MQIRKGDKFGKWTVLNPKAHDSQVEVLCECGTMRRFRKSVLLEGYSRQCKDCSKKSRAKYNIANKDMDVPNDPEKDKAMIDDWLRTNKPTVI